jgi:hypothetical protein
MVGVAIWKSQVKVSAPIMHRSDSNIGTSTLANSVEKRESLSLPFLESKVISPEFLNSKPIHHRARFMIPYLLLLIHILTIWTLFKLWEHKELH